MNELIIKHHKNERLDMQLILACAAIAFMAAILVVFSVLLIFGIDLLYCNDGLLVGGFFCFFISAWMLLLYLNC